MGVVNQISVQLVQKVTGLIKGYEQAVKDRLLESTNFALQAISKVRHLKQSEEPATLLKIIKSALESYTPDGKDELTDDPNHTFITQLDALWLAYTQYWPIYDRLTDYCQQQFNATHLDYEKAPPKHFHTTLIELANIPDQQWQGALLPLKTYADSLGEHAIALNDSNKMKALYEFYLVYGDIQTRLIEKVDTLKAKCFVDCPKDDIETLQALLKNLSDTPEDYNWHTLMQSFQASIAALSDDAKIIKNALTAIHDFYQYWEPIYITLLSEAGDFEKQIEPVRKQIFSLTDTLDLKSIKTLLDPLLPELVSGLFFKSDTVLKENLTELLNNIPNDLDPKLTLSQALLDTHSIALPSAALNLHVADLSASMPEQDNNPPALSSSIDAASSEERRNRSFLDKLLKRNHPIYEAYERPATPADSFKLYPQLIDKGIELITQRCNLEGASEESQQEEIEKFKVDYARPETEKAAHKQYEKLLDVVVKMEEDYFSLQENLKNIKFLGDELSRVKNSLRQLESTNAELKKQLEAEKNQSETLRNKNEELIEKNQSLKDRLQSEQTARLRTEQHNLEKEANLSKKISELTSEKAELAKHTNDLIFMLQNVLPCKEERKNSLSQDKPLLPSFQQHCADDPNKSTSQHLAQIIADLKQLSLYQVAPNNKYKH